MQNVVLQYMTFPPGSAERGALVPVLALLLQFNASELAQVDSASKTTSIWTSAARPVKEVKLHPPAAAAAAPDRSVEEPDHRPLASARIADGHRENMRSPGGNNGAANDTGEYQPPLSSLQYNEV
jgi:hypothetical protein